MTAATGKTDGQGDPGQPSDPGETGRPANPASPANTADPGPARLSALQRKTAALIAAGLVAVVAASVLLSGIDGFPEDWNVHLADPIDDARRWLIQNQTSHWLYSVILDPIADSIDSAIRRLESILRWIPWFSYIAGAWLGMWWVRGAAAGALAAGAVTGFGLVEVWDEGIQTLALMGVAVLLSVAVGVPLGVIASRSDRAQRLIRPLLDTMQTMPGFVYLVPFVLLFGIGRVPALISTMIFALPPVVRATDLGIREVPTETIEASVMFGATSRQTLRKVRLPLARPAILVGTNQTINLAMSMVVIAALIGAGGLGQVVLRSLQGLDVGRAAEAGMAIVFMAILLDRFFSGLATPDRYIRRRPAGYAAGAIGVATLIGGLVGVRAFPGSVTLHFANLIDEAVDWAQVNLFDIAGWGIGTGPFSDFITIRLVTPLRELLSQDIAWPVLLALAAAIALALGGWRLAAGVCAALLGIGLLGMWELSMDTLAQTLVAVGVTLLFGVPIGILTARSDRLRTVVRPVLDFLQTIPSFVLLVPVSMLFNVGRVPGIIASVVYALPAAIHFTDLGLRSVSKQTLEAATSFGATRRQRLRDVELPLAAPQIMTAVNQTIMLVLAMVVIAGLVGGGGLGLETVRALLRSDAVGRGFEAGIAIVLLAGILDRLTRAAADRLRPPPAAA